MRDSLSLRYACLLQASRTILMRLPAPERADITRICLQSRDQRRLVKLRIVSEHEHDIPLVELLAGEEALWPIDHDVVSYGEPARLGERSAGVEIVTS